MLDPAPTLEELRKLTKAAWLWDGARGRIVWANPAGVSFFSGESVFDLIDRPFDPAEPGVERIMKLTQSLQRDDIETVELSFPSANQARPLLCQCRIHTLADGRSGLLVVDETPLPKIVEEIPPERLAAAFQLLPLAAVFMGSDGSLHQRNNAAKALLLEDDSPSLITLLDNPGQAEDILQRLSNATIVSDIVRIQTIIGKRDIRLTLTRLSQEADPLAYAIILMDDITERRALERLLAHSDSDQAPPVPAASEAVSDTAKPLAPADHETFHQLGKALNNAVAEQINLAPPQAIAPRRRAVDLPPIIKNNLEQAKDAILVAQDKALLYANAKALSLLGFASLAELIADDVIWDLFSTRQHRLPVTNLKLSPDKTVRLSASLSTIAWLNGPARQFVLHPETSPPETPEKSLKLPDAAPRPAAVPTQPLAIIPLPYPKAAEPTPVLKHSDTDTPSPTPLPSPAHLMPSSLTLTDPANAEELRHILDTATDGIITLDQEGQVHTFSAGAEAIFGYRNAEVVDKKFADLLTLESRKIFRDYLAALKGPSLASVFNDGREVMAVVKQGGTVPLFLTISALQSANSKTAFCVVVRDITQWKRTESELRQAKDEAETMSRQKSEFLARISHELRTPLNAILGFSEVMRLERFGTLNNDKYRGYVNDIHSSGTLLLSLINDLLDLSKVEAGQLELNFTSVDLNETVDSTMQMLQEAATSARVILRKALPADLPNVVADQRSMRQIMINTLSNAVKYTDPGGQVIVSALLNKSGELKLRIKDTGIGMSQEQVEQALQPFQRVATKGREVPGTGLGLPLTKALAEANRTSFTITSEPRKGTLVELTFPTTRVLAD